MRSRSLFGSIAFAATALSASAQSISVQLHGSYIESIQTAGVTVPHADLRPGFSTGSVSEHGWGTTIRSADGRNLESYFMRDGTNGAWEVSLLRDPGQGPWVPGPGPAQDFFVFDVGGNDNLLVRPRLVGGQLGATTSLNSWSATGVVAEGGPNAGQRVHGIGFRFEDLKRSNGTQLSSTDRIEALVFESSTIDGTAFLFRDPGANAGSNGNGSGSVRPAAPTALSPVEVTFRGPWASETDLSPNPFLDYRLNVRFTGPGGQTVNVPGFFDADGANGDTGNLWAARFLPPVRGAWTATASMRSGANVAVDLNPSAGSPVSTVDGRSVQFQVGSIRSGAEGFYRVGTLRDVGKHHRKFENGPYYLKAGTNGPENFLGLRCVDDVTKSGGEGNLHSFDAHISDWRPGDPILSRGNTNDDGRGVIGALNYLGDKGVNSLFLMVMNLGGDGKDVYPFLGPKDRSFEKTHYDTSRLRQWNVIFEHAQARSISLSLVMNETEIDNELWLDGGQLGAQRKLFYREIVARFGHHPAIRWNICEENDYTLTQLDQFASWIKAQDGDTHAVSVHNNPNDLAMFQSLASNPNFDHASLQFDPNLANSHVEQVRAFTAQAGRPWVVDADEQGPWQTGLTSQNAADTRKRILYDALFSGGGVEFYLGYHDLPMGGDLSLEDFRTRDEMWNYIGHARSFMEENLPFWDMAPDDNLVRNENGAFGGAEAFTIPGEVYAIYFPNASSTGQLNLQGNSQEFELRWFNPRSGAFVGGAQSLGSGGGWRNLPSPPNSSNEDWIALVRENLPLSSSTTSASTSAFGSQLLTLDAGSSYAGRTYVLLSNYTGMSQGFQLGALQIPINFDRLTRVSINDVNGAIFRNQLGVLDGNGRANILMQLSPQHTGALIGRTVRHVGITLAPYDYVSNVVTLELLP